MATRLVNIDRQTPMLLPVDLRDWVRDDDLANFVLEAVEATDLSGASLNVRGSGSAQYPPAMMLALLIYSYATGRFSSREIEMATHRDVSVRYLAGNTHPDHDTICKFRRENQVLIHQCFVEVLQLARETGILKMGQVSIDGTKVAAATSKRATRTLEQIELELKELDHKVQELMEKAEQADQKAEPSQGVLPKELAQAKDRQAKLLAAKKRLAEQKRQLAAAVQAEREQGHDLNDPPRPKSSKVDRRDAINLTDEDSRIMPRSTGGYIQGYNGQVAVSAQPEGGLILGTEVSQSTQDRRELAGVVESIPTEVGGFQEVIVDCGYDNTDQIVQVEQRTGAKVYCPFNRPLGKMPKVSERGYRRRKRWEFRHQMARRMETPEAGERMKLRRITVEPVFGIIKQVLGFRQFSMRGLRKVQLEWELVALAFNCRRIAKRRLA